MTDASELRAAVASGVVGSSESFQELLGAIVHVARSIFGAKASSILLLDEEAGELVFEAVVGEGEESLLGTRFPADHGIAGWVLATRTPLVIEDVEQDPRHARDVAEGTGYVPKGIMAAPLLTEDAALGVLSVLDRPEQSLFSLQERGRLCVGPGEEVYQGQIVGIHSRDNDLTVNPLKAKKLTNIRAAGSDEKLLLTPPVRFSLEQAMEFISDDELVEVTPAAIRLRKRALTEQERKRMLRAASA